MKIRKPIYNPTVLPLKSQNPDMFRECCWHLSKRGGVRKTPSKKKRCLLRHFCLFWVSVFLNAALSKFSGFSTYFTLEYNASDWRNGTSCSSALL